MNNIDLTICSFLLAFCFVWWVTPKFIPFLRRLHFGQAIREEGPKSHQKKAGTPTMGGLVIMGGITVSILLLCLYTKISFWLPMVAVLGFGLIGFLDDYIKVTKKHNLGLRAWQKLVFQFVLALALTIYAGYLNPSGEEMIPFIGRTIELGIGYYFLTFFSIVAVVNAVNLSDGLDGLASGLTGIVMMFFTLIAIMGNLLEPAIFGGAVIGACFGFLRHNSNPADLFMGDTGSMALGGAVIAIAILTHTQFYILTAGFIFVLEALSVVIQVGYFKVSGGKRIFKMTPIHHHFELSGWSETRVVTVFWVIALVCVIVSFIGFRI